jgi:hypothetical protein
VPTVSQTWRLVADVKAISHAVGGKLKGVFWVVRATKHVVLDDANGACRQAAIKPNTLSDSGQMINVVHRIRS